MMPLMLVYCLSLIVLIETIHTYKGLLTRMLDLEHYLRKNGHTFMPDFF